MVVGNYLFCSQLVLRHIKNVLKEVNNDLLTVVKYIEIHSYSEGNGKGFDALTYVSIFTTKVSFRL